MEFKSLTNIETSFRQIRLFALVFICLCALVTGFAVWNSYSFAEKQRQKIYVLDNGKSLMLALSQGHNIFIHCTDTSDSKLLDQYVLYIR